MRTAGKTAWKKVGRFFLLTWVWWLLSVFTGAGFLAGKMLLALGRAKPLLAVLHHPVE